MNSNAIPYSTANLEAKTVDRQGDRHISDMLENQPAPSDVRNHWSGNRGFWYLIATQFQGAFSDNAYKYVVTLVALLTATSAIQGNQRVALIGALFIFPFLIFS